MNSQINISGQTVKVKGFHKWSFQEVNVDSQINRVEKHCKLNDHRNELYREVIMNSQPEQVNVVVFWMSLLIWLITPVFITGYIVWKISTGFINWYIKELRKCDQIDELIQQTRINIRNDQLNQMFDSIGYRKRLV